MKMTIEQAPAFVRRLAERNKEAALRGLFGAAQRMVEHVGEIIQREPRVPVDRGIYRAGWKAKRLPNGAKVYNDTPHGGLIEDGVRGDNVKPGRAMIDALASWVARKGLTGSARGAEKRAEARSIAFAIARSMKQKGIFNGGKGLKIYERAKLKLRDFIDEEVKREMEKSPP